MSFRDPEMTCGIFTPVIDQAESSGLCLSMWSCIVYCLTGGKCNAICEICCAFSVNCSRDVINPCQDRLGSLDYLE